jgi:hypothetical protein
MRRALSLAVVVACTPKALPVQLAGEWPAKCGDYDEITEAWTRKAVLRGQYQEVLELVATFKSPEWRCAHADREADHRGATSDARAQHIAQARADEQSAYEIELMVTTWDRRENDLDRGKKSVWHVALVDEHGNEVAPTEIVRDKRPAFTVRSEFPALGDFALPYIARFPHDANVLGPNVRVVKLRMSSERGGVELEWRAP